MTLMETRDSLGKRVEAAHFADENTIITKNGDPRAVIVSYESYQHLRRGAVGQDRGAAVGQTPVGTCPDESVSTPPESPDDLGKRPGMSGTDVH